MALPRSIQEQREVGRTLTALDDNRRQEQDHLAKLRLLRQGLMDDLLSGRLRVTTAVEATPA
jgi:type I restriction enzyme S subunit